MLSLSFIATHNDNRERRICRPSKFSTHCRRLSVLQMIAFLALLIITETSGLLGYDCGGTTFNVTTVSLLDVGECRTPEEKPNSTSTYIQLLQVAEYMQTRVVTCRIEIDRQIFHCGMHSHVSLVHGSRRKYLVDLDQRDCTRLHDTRTFVFGHGSIVTELQPNITNYRTLTLTGTAGVDGTCNGGQFSDSYGTWNNVVVEASIYISFKDYYATTKINQDLLVLRSGTHLRASDLAGIDEDGANVYWSPLPNDKCTFHAYDVLYQGFATKIVDLVSRYPIVYSLTSAKATFALAKKSERSLCGYTLIQTEHPKLVIVETSRDNPFAKQARILVENLDALAYMNSKLIYIKKHIKTQIQALYYNVINQKCKLEQQVLRNAVTLAYNQPDLFAYHLMKGPGYVATVAGEVAHIIKCIPVNVTRRSTETCYLELPVTFFNNSMFLNPKTRILVKTGTPVDCNPLLPVMYNVKGGWMSLTPKPAAVVPPQTLEPLTRPTWKYIDAEHLAENGIYSTADLSRLREHIMFPIEQPTLINNFAKAAAGHRVPPGGISITNLLDDNALDLITKSASEKIFGGFLQFGTITAGLIGIWIVVKSIKIIADTLIHGYALHSVYGWSIHLLGAVFSSITSLLLHLGGRPPKGPTADIPGVSSTPVNNVTDIRISMPSDDPPTELAPIHRSNDNEPPSAPPRAIYPQPAEVEALRCSLHRLEGRLNKCLPPPATN